MVGSVSVSFFSPLPRPGKITAETQKASWQRRRTGTRDNCTLCCPFLFLGLRPHLTGAHPPGSSLKRVTKGAEGMSGLRKFLPKRYLSYFAGGALTGLWAGNELPLETWRSGSTVLPLLALLVSSPMPPCSPTSSTCPLWSLLAFCNVSLSLVL